MAAPDVVQQVFGDNNIFSGTGDVTVFQLPQAAADERRLLLPLARKVEQFWIKGVLEKSVHSAAVVELGKEQMRTAIEHPWGRTVESPGGVAETVRPDKAIGEIFAESGRALLILGEPGAGKTITLLDLARALIARFDKEPTEATPVVINLSTWREKHKSLNGWVETELRTKYFVPPRRARAWLETSQLLLLLDGLDEVPLESRAACVRAINAFLESSGPPGIVVCSRLREYLALPERLKFTGAIRLQPLTGRQIDDYLARGGEQLEGVRTIMREDALLQELANSPLMLSVISLAYRGVPATQVSAQAGNTREVRRGHLFESYVQRMFGRTQAESAEFSEPQTRVWLGWLARQMKARSVTVFLLESLQPSWLPSARERRIYAFSSRFASAFLWGALWWLMILFFVDQMRPHFWKGTVFVCVLFLSAGLLAGIVAALRLERKRKGEKRWKERFLLAAEIFIYPVIMGMLLAILTGPFFERVLHVLFATAPAAVALKGWKLGLFAGIWYGLVFGVGFGMRGARKADSPDIRLSEAMGLSFAAAKRGARAGAIAGLLLGLPFAIFGLSSIWPDVLATGMPVLMSVVVSVILMLLCGVIFGAIAAAFTMFTASESERKTRPGEGLRLAFQNAMVAAMVVGVLITIPPVLYAILLRTPYNWRTSLMGTGAFMLAAALWYGGFDLVQHLFLRLQLRRLGFTPRHYVRFLDYAAQLIFLQKVGSGYIFMHRRLLDFFADADPPSFNASPVPPTSDHPIESIRQSRAGGSHT